MISKYSCVFFASFLLTNHLHLNKIVEYVHVSLSVSDLAGIFAVI